MNPPEGDNYPATPHSFAMRLDEDIAVRLRERYLAPELAMRIDEQRAHLARSLAWAAGSTPENAESYTRGGLERFARGSGWDADLCWRGEVVGAVGVPYIEGPGGASEFGFWLVAERQGRGIVTRAATRLVSYLFQRHDSGKVVVAADPENTRSIAVIERLGMQREAVMRRSHLGGHGRSVDMAFYGLLRGEWEAARASFPAPLSDRFSLRLDRGLELSLPERADVAELSAVVAHNRDHLRPWLPWTADPTPSSQRGYVDNLAMPELVAGRGLHCLVRQDGRLVGTVALHGVDHVTRRGQLGYWLAAGAMGRGIITRSITALIERCFSLPVCAGQAFERLEIRAAVENLPSRRVAERLGFRFEGVLRSEELVHGRRLDHAVYGLLRSEWAGAVR